MEKDHALRNMVRNLFFFFASPICYRATEEEYGGSSLVEVRFDGYLYRLLEGGGGRGRSRIGLWHERARTHATRRDGKEIFLHPVSSVESGEFGSAAITAPTAGWDGVALSNARIVTLRA